MVETAHFKVRLGHWEREAASGLEAHYGASSRLKWEIRCYESLPSTMDEARILAAQLTPERAGFILCESQPAGRGRQGRVWEGARGALFLSLVFAHSKSDPVPTGFSLVAGLAVSEVLESLGAKTGLKWPNDILSLMGRKLGGILVESFNLGEQSYLAAGFGINIFEAPENLTGAVALRNIMEEEPPDCIGLGVKIAPHLYAAWEKFRKSGFEAFREKWLARAMYLGHEIQIEAEGSQLRGKFSTIDEHGCLVLDAGSGVTHRVLSGHFVGVRRG